MKSFVANPDTVKRKWYVVDANGATLGRLASEVVAVLRGKNKSIFAPHVDCGDYVIVINTDKIAVTSKKLNQEVHYSHSLCVGGMKETALREFKAKRPEKVIKNTAKGMLSKGPLGVQMYRKLRAYAGENHSHQAQKPGVLTIKNRKEYVENDK